MATWSTHARRFHCSQKRERAQTSQTPSWHPGLLASPRVLSAMLMTSVQTGWLNVLRRRRVTFTNLHKLQMLYLHVSPTSLQSKGQIWLRSLTCASENVKSRLSLVVPSPALRAPTWPTRQRGPRQRLRLFVCVFISARFSVLSDETVT